MKAILQRLDIYDPDIIESLEKSSSICPSCSTLTPDYPVSIELEYFDGSLKITNSEEEPVCLMCLSKDSYGFHGAIKAGYR